jgi:hypothetical protein
VTQWICPTCQRPTTGRQCSDGHDMPPVMSELVKLVDWIIGASEDRDIVYVAEETLVELGLEKDDG